MLDHPLGQLEVSLSTHRVSHRGVQTPAAAHCHQHRIHPLILLLSLVTSSEQRYCGHSSTGTESGTILLGVVLERNTFTVAVIQELSPKSKNRCIRNYTTVRKGRTHGQGEGLLIFIHRSITFSKQPCCCVVVVRLSRPMEGNGVTQIFRSTGGWSRWNILMCFLYIYIHIAF